MPPPIPPTSAKPIASQPLPPQQKMVRASKINPSPEMSAMLNGVNAGFHSACRSSNTGR